MGQQLGVLPISATLDNMTFYKSKDGMRVKKQSKISKETIDTSKAFERTRENNSDFGTAGKAAQLVRAAFRGTMKDCKDYRVVSRLLKEMVKVVKADATNKRGKRNVLDGQLGLLQDFNFNAKAPLVTVFNEDTPITIDRVTGAVQMHIQSFIPGEALVKPNDATHFKVLSAASALDFVNAKSVDVAYSTDYFPVDDTATGPIDIALQLPANSNDPFIIVLGIQFFMVEHGVQYALRTHEFNALKIVGVDTV